MNILMQVTSVLEWGLLSVLLVLSVWSIGIMIDRRRVLAAETQPESVAKARELIVNGDWAALEQFASAQSGLHAGSLRAALHDGQAGVSGRVGADGARVDRAVKSYLTERRLELERGLPVLATLGSNAPFIGLLGTVLGIIRAFAALGGDGGGQAGATSVMSGISGALFATAAGLFVAIPAVIAFNTFSNRLRKLLAECDALKDLYLSRRLGG